MEARICCVCVTEDLRTLVARRTHFEGFGEVRNPIALPNLPNIPARPFFRDAHPTSLALKMRTDGQRAVRFALSGAEDIYARRWRTVAESGSIMWCAESVFEYSEQPGPVQKRGRSPPPCEQYPAQRACQVRAREESA